MMLDDDIVAASPATVYGFTRDPGICNIDKPYRYPDHSRVLLPYQECLTTPGARRSSSASISAIASERSRAASPGQAWST